MDTLAAPATARLLPDGTVTFLFTDIEGSTRMWEASPDAMRVALARHDVLLRAAIGAHEGSIFKTGGDAFYAVFPQAVGALRAAMDSQLALAAEPWPNGAHIRVRMALNTGQAELRDGDYFGPALNRVARVLNAGHGGQTLLTLRASEACGEALPSGVSLKPLGEFALKDLPQAQTIFQLCCPTLPTTFRALRISQDDAAENVPSIAVLPFVNMSRDADNEYFADGLSEELLNVLSKIRGLRVASRTSAWSFKGKEVDVPTVAQKLGVNHILAGSVRKAGNRVRISAELVTASTDTQLWAEAYNRELDDIFAVQDDIAQSVVKELRERLLGVAADGKVEAAKVVAEVQAASKGRSENPEAYQLYLQGQFFRTHLTKESLTRAQFFYEQALKLDPDYGLAWAGLSRAASDLAGQSWIPRAEGYATARMAAQRAIALEPELPESHTALGWVQWVHDWEYEAAAESFRRALQLAPGSTLAINAAATLVGNRGNLEEAVALFRRAVGLDPLNVSLNRNLGLYCLAAGALEEADTALHQCLQLSPTGGMTHCWRSLVRLREGRLDDALAEVLLESNVIFRLVGLAAIRFARGEFAAADEALTELARDFGEDSPYQLAEVHAARGENDQAFAWLERTYAQRDPGLSYMRMDPFLGPLHDDPRWNALLTKIGLADLP
ncbi:MAG: tetratricopeptide repeat protein [Casimicrobiaceae bacterium]